MIFIVINHSGGLHMRVVATCADLLSKILPPSCLSEVFLSFRNQKVQFVDLMAVTSLQVRRGDEVGISLECDDYNETLLAPLIAYLSDSSKEILSPSTVDTQIQTAVLTDQAILNNMQYGLIVVNEQNRISFVNPFAIKLLELGSCSTLLGRKSDEIIPQAKLSTVLCSRKPETAIKYYLKKHVVLTTSSPIIVEGVLRGAMTVFQDISQVERLAEELEVVKRLKEQYNLVLETVHDGICVTDANGIIRYVNSAYELLHNVRADDIVGQSVYEVSPTGLRVYALKTGHSTRGKVTHKGSKGEIVAEVNPIQIGGQLHGIVSVTQNLSDVRELFNRVQSLQQETQYLKEELFRSHPSCKAFSALIGKSGVFLDSIAMASKASQTNSTVLITGESGTGKELIAKAIHLASGRSGGPFIRVNCAGIPVTLIESELFGHERGAFTGAVTMRKGKFEAAQNGTIFLDEIGELPLEVQAKLLRVLQEHEVERLGGTAPIRLNVRVIAATNRNLEKAVEEIRFRQDLYYRINVVRIPLPPLRDRVGDVTILAEHFLRELCASLGKSVIGFTREVLTCFEHHSWPGNVRELRNVVESALNWCEEKWITPKDLPAQLSSPSSTEIERGLISVVNSKDELLTMEEYEKQIIAKALVKYSSFNAAAKALGVTHKTVAAKARKFGLVK